MSSPLQTTQVSFLNVPVRTLVGHAQSMVYKCSLCKTTGIKVQDALLPGSGVPGSELLRLYELCGEFPFGVTPFIDPMHPLKVGDLARHVLCRTCGNKKSLRFLNVVETMDRWVVQNTTFLEEFGDFPAPVPSPSPRPEDEYIELARTWPGLACGLCNKALNASTAWVPLLDELYAVVHPGLSTASALTVSDIARQVKCRYCRSLGSFPFMKTVSLMAIKFVMGWEWRKNSGASAKPKRVEETVSDLVPVEAHKPQSKKGRRRRGPKPDEKSANTMGKNYGDGKKRETVGKREKKSGKKQKQGKGKGK